MSENYDTITEESAYDRVGGAAAVGAVVDRLYQLLLEDPELAPYFAGTEIPRLKQHMAALLTKVLGGPDRYSGRDLGPAHEGLGITREHYWRVSLHLYSVLFGLQVPMDIMHAVGSVLASVEEVIVAPPQMQDA